MGNTCGSCSKIVEEEEWCIKLNMESAGLPCYSAASYMLLEHLLPFYWYSITFFSPIHWLVQWSSHHSLNITIKISNCTTLLLLTHPLLCCIIHYDPAWMTIPSVASISGTGKSIFFSKHSFSKIWQHQASYTLGLHIAWYHSARCNLPPISSSNVRPQRIMIYLWLT